MSDYLPPADRPDEGPPPDDRVDPTPEDAALSALVGSLPRDPAPSGFRDAVLAALDLDLSSEADETKTSVPGPTPAAAPEPPSRLRRAARIMGGFALTALVLSGVAVLWSSTADRSVGVSHADRQAVEAEPPSTAGAPNRDRAIVSMDDFAEADFAPPPVPPPAAMSGDSVAALAPADADDATAFGALEETAPMASALAAAEPSATAAKAGAFGGDAAVRVVRIQTPSPLLNQQAVRQFEAAAARNSIVPRSAALLSADVGFMRDESLGEAVDVQPSKGPGEQVDKAPPVGPVGVLVVAEPGQIEAALTAFRADLAADSATAGVTLFDAAPLASEAATRLLRSSGSQAEAGRPAPGEMNQPAPSRVAGEAFEEPNVARSLGVTSNGIASDGVASDGVASDGVASDGVEPELQVRPPGEPNANAARQRTGPRGDLTPFQMRVAPPVELEAVETAVTAPSPADAPRAADTRRVMPRKLSRPEHKGLQANERLNEATWGQDDRVPVLLLFEPTTESAAEAGDDSSP